MRKPGAKWMLLAAAISAPALAKGVKEVSNAPVEQSSGDRAREQGQAGIHQPSRMGANYDAPLAGSQKSPAAAQANAPGDVDFIARLHRDNLQEVALGDLAISQGYSEKVKDFGNMLATDHRAADRQLSHEADVKGLDLEALGPGLRQWMDQQQEQDKQTLAKLRPLQAPDFDRQFLTLMVQEHQKSIALVNERKASLSDPTLRNLAGGLLPTLDRHLHEAQDLLKHPGGPIHRARRSAGAR